MTIREALVKGTEILKNAGIEAPVIDAGVMLCYVIKCDRTWLYAHDDEYLDGSKYEEYSLLLFKRCKGMPVQYITGRQEFMGLDFHVEPGVLIPRHDTEILVETVTGLGNDMGNNLKILEIGTGSGCIAVSLAYYISYSFVTAVDISETALDIARFNAIKHGVAGRIAFMRSNLFEKVNITGFDIIVSNPPYLQRREIPALQKEVRDFEPVLALEGGEDGLDFYRSIIEKAPLYLKQRGCLALEAGINQADSIKGLMKRSFEDICIKKDLAGIDRVVYGKVKL